MADDMDSSDDDHEDLFDGDTFGFLANQPSTFNDDEELLPDSAQYNNSAYMAPSDAILANQLMTSHESISAYKLQKSVEITENAPLLWNDINNDEPVIDYNKLLSNIDIEIPQSIVQYSHSDMNETKRNNDNANEESNENSDEESEPLWQKEFERNALISKQTILQRNNPKYKNMKFEYDKYHNIDMDRLVNSNNGQKIPITHSNDLSRFISNHWCSDNAQNLTDLMGYNDNNECELLSMDPRNIQPSNDTDLDLSHLLERTQCDFENEIIINDSIIMNDVLPSENHIDIDIDMKAIQPHSMRCNKIIEMKATKHKVSKDGSLKAKYATRQRLNQLTEQTGVNGRKRKNRDSDDSSNYMFQSAKRRKVRHKNMKFKIRTDLREYESSIVDNDRRQSQKNEDLDLLLPDTNDNIDNSDCDSDAIGDDLFDLMPEFEQDWNGNNETQFGTVNHENETDNENENENENGNGKEEQEFEMQQKKEKRPRKTMPLLKCVQNNSSIWPNRNREYSNCEWLDSVIVSDSIRPKKEMNTNLIIDLNDYRMEWTEEFIKNICNKKNKSEMDTKEKAQSIESLYSAKKWNLSNDNQYTFTDISVSSKRNVHTPMAYNLNKEIFAQIQNIDEWVGLHRKPVKLNAKNIKITLSSRRRIIDNKYDKYSQAIPKNWSELSATQDRIVLLEYLEESPLIISNVGMTSNITTLYRKKNANEKDPKLVVEDGTVKFLKPKEKSPLLGAPRQTKWVTVVENKLSVSPVWSHTDNIIGNGNGNNNNLFLLIGRNHTYFIRKIDALFSVGQIQPRMTVYHPGSRKFRSYMHDRCKVHIYRLLQNKRIISIADIRNDFGLETEDSIKETLRTVAESGKGLEGGWVRKSDFINHSELEIQQMVKPEQEVLRQLFMMNYCQLYNAGISAHLLGGSRGGAWKRVLKSLVFNKDLLDNLFEMKKELEAKSEEENTIKLKTLQLIEELLFCTKWYVSDQFLRCKRGEGEMQLNGYGNPFKRGEGFNYLRDRDKTSSEAIRLMIASAGNRANTKADFRRMPMPKAIQILKQRYLVPDLVLAKLESRRKIMELLQKKSRDALSAGSNNKTVLRYARLTGSRKTFARQEYMKKIKRLMKQHLLMLRGKKTFINESDSDMMEHSDINLDNTDSEESEDNNTAKKKKRTKLKCVRKYTLRYTYCYNDQITGERKKETIDYPESEYPDLLRKYRGCIAENDKKFVALKEFSKLYQLQKEQSLDIFMNDRQRERHEKMEKIRNMPSEEREEILSRLEKEKNYITCSSCRRKGHNSNNKYCPKYHENKERRLNEQKMGSNHENRFGQNSSGNGIDAFIDRAIDKKHKSYRSIILTNNKNSKRKRKKRDSANSVSDDPRLQFVAVLRHIMNRAKAVNGANVFKSDPTKELPHYCDKVKEPVCLDWIDANIEYTEQCIRAPLHKKTNTNSHRKEYKTFETFLYDIKLLHSNSNKYNGAQSGFTRLAWTIVEEVNSMQRQYKSTINELNAEVSQQYMLIDLQPILNNLINGILDAPTLDAFKSLDKYRSARSLTGNNSHTIKTKGLYEIRQKVHDKRIQTFADFVYDLKELQQFCYDLNRPEFETGLKILPTQFENKLKPFKESLKKIDPDSKNHFYLNKKPPFI